MNTNKFDALFKKVIVKSNNRGISVAPDAVRLLRSNTDSPLNRFTISKELSELLPWSENEKLDLYQATKNLFAIVPAKAGLLTLKTNKNTFQIYSTDLCTTLKSITQATSFSGWVDDDKLFFRTNK